MPSPEPEPAVIRANTTSAPAPGRWRATATEQLVGVLQQLSQARSLDTIIEIVREAARNLAAADGAAFVLRDGDRCYYADESAIGPLWKGCHFPMSASISGWVIINGFPAAIEDIYSDPRIPVEAYRPTFVKSLAMVPIRRNAPIGTIGTYWASRHQPLQEELDILQALADTTSVAMENIRLYEEQQRQLKVLQEKEERINRQREALEVFTRAMAHDLKEPVRAVQSFARLLEGTGISEDKRREYLRFISGAADRMDTLFEAISRYIQLDDMPHHTGRTCSMDRVVEVARKNLAPLLEESEVQISCAPLPYLAADQDHMVQVMQNLLANAVRHGGREIRVTIHVEQRDEVYLFSVRDNGRGVPSEYLEKIFRPFARLTDLKDNSGLGLAVCRKTVERYGGRIWCQSQQGNGATFLFTFPKKNSSADTGLSAASLANILLVDDAEFDIELAQIMMLEHDQLRCNLLIARNGREAMDMLMHSFNSGSTIDLVLLDINMPGVDGFEVLAAIRNSEVLGNLPVIMCTGSTYEKDLQRAQSLAADGYLVKPPTYEKLKPIVDEIASLELHRVNGNTYLARA